MAKVGDRYRVVRAGRNIYLKEGQIVRLIFQDENYPLVIESGLQPPWHPCWRQLGVEFQALGFNEYCKLWS